MQHAEKQNYFMFATFDAKYFHVLEANNSFVLMSERYKSLFSTVRSILESTAKMLKTRATVSTVYSHTRFTSSAFVQWRRLIQSYIFAVKNLIIYNTIC